MEGSIGKSYRTDLKRHFPLFPRYLDRRSRTAGSREKLVSLAGKVFWPAFKWCTRRRHRVEDHPVYLTTFLLHAEKSEPTCHAEKGGHPNVSSAWRCLDTSRLTTRTRQPVLVTNERAMLYDGGSRMKITIIRS